MNFLKKIFSPTILIISFLLLIYIFYKSEFIWNGDNRNYYKTYYLISSILICFSIITFFINDIIKQYLIISGISLIVSLYLFEGYITFTKPFLKIQSFEKQDKKKWDRRTRIQVFEDLKKNNQNVTIRVVPKHLLKKNNPFLYLSSTSNSLIIDCNENGYYSTYQTDRYGFNNPDNEWDKEEIEYLLIGDSFANSACVNRPDDIGSVLRTISNKSVLSLGVNGNGPLLEYATLREYLDTNIKKVLWIYYEGNDFKDLQNEKKNRILMNYIKDLTYSQNLKIKQKEIDYFNRKYIDQMSLIKKNKKTKFEKYIKFVKLYNTRLLIFPSKSYTPELLPEFKKILQLAREFTKKNNSKLYFIYLPEYNRYKITYDDTNYNLIKNIVTELKIPFIDIHKEVFENELNPLKLFPFELPGHYNVDGYKKVAETIYKFTKD